MKVLFDGYIYKLQGNGGINRYFNEIISRLPNGVRPCIYGEHPALTLRPQNKNVKYISSIPRGIYSLGRYASNRFDLIHPTYYHLTPPLEYSKIKTRCIVTVHDFVMAKYADKYEKSQKVIVAQEEAIKSADYIVCVSESTRSDLLNRFPECEDRSSVTHLASSLSRSQNTSKSIHPGPYCLYVGSRVFYKNFHWALEAISILKKRSLDVDLVVVGESWNAEERSLISNAYKGKIRLVENPNDEVLSSLYENALALIYPSNYEGFGLPPLEAMTMGCPVIAQRTSSLPEVVGEAGILMDPARASAKVIAEAVQSLLMDSVMRSNLCAKGLAKSQDFSWHKTAQATLEAYNKATS